MILVLCANAGVDRTYEVDNFAVGQYHYPRRQKIIAGGKGVNVARALRVFGQKVVITGFAGGYGGKFIHDQCLAFGAQPAFVGIGEESRVCINIVDGRSHAQTRLDEVGPLVTPSEVERLRRRWSKALDKAAVAVISGSAPRGVPLDLYGGLVAAARAAKVPVLLDARGELLSRALDARPTLVKLNLAEMQALCGESLAVPQGVVRAAGELTARGVAAAVITLGHNGAIGVTADGQRWWAKPPKIEYVSDVGSGDAMMAGIAAAMAGGRPFADQLRWGTGAGAANAATFGACTFDRQALLACLRDVTLFPLDADGAIIQEESANGQSPRPAQPQPGPPGNAAGPPT